MAKLVKTPKKELFYEFRHLKSYHWIRLGIGVRVFVYQDVQNSQFQSMGDSRMKKGVSNQETCQERNSEAKSPKIPC